MALAGTGKVGALAASNRTLMEFDGLTCADATLTPPAGDSRFCDTVQVTEQAMAEIAKALARFGVHNRDTAYFSKKVGRREDGDFEKEQQMRKVRKVTEGTSGPGECHVRFDHTGGWHGLRISRVALASAPKESPEQRTAVRVDEHPGTPPREGCRLGPPRAPDSPSPGLGVRSGGEGRDRGIGPSPYSSQTTRSPTLNTFSHAG